MMQYPYYGQMQQPVFQQTGLYGRVVDNFDSIMINDIPMNGNVAVFPKSDMSEICVKKWNANGEINTVRYKPCFEPQNPQMNILPSTNVETATTANLERKNEIMEQLKLLNEKIDDFISTKSVSAKSRKEVKDES